MLTVFPTSRITIEDDSERGGKWGDRKTLQYCKLCPLTMMVAQVCDLELGEFVHTLGDAHIYSNHFEQVNMQLARTPGLLPVMKINSDVRDLFAFTFDDFQLEGYKAECTIAAPITV